MNASFGVELEFSILEPDGKLALMSSPYIVDKYISKELNITTELGSFQIELNPGPWDLSRTGIMSGIKNLKDQVDLLEKVVRKEGFRLSSLTMPVIIDNEVLNSKNFFTKSDRYLATAKYFSSRGSKIHFKDSSNIILKGEQAVALINEIHIHIRLSDAKSNLQLFNILNKQGYNLARNFLSHITINGKELSDECTTMHLFECANGEYDKNNHFRRVSFLPYEISNYSEYLSICEGFNRIPILDGKSFLPIEDTVYFWVRLRGDKDDFRIEYRCIDMTYNWESTIIKFLTLPCISQYYM